MSANPARGRIRSKAIEKRQRILDATASILVATGSTEFPLQDVANAVGIYTASIYYYFDSREELIREVLLSSITQFHAQLSQSVAALPADGTPLDRLREAIRATVRINASMDDYKRAYAFVLGQPGRLLDDPIRAQRTEIRRLWSKLLKEAKDAGQIGRDVDIDILRYVLTGATQWVSYWFKPEGPLSPDQVADAFADLLLNGCLNTKKGG
jgi:AcrR family transcriptional regulator